MSKRTWIIIGCVLLGVSGILWWLTNRRKNDIDLTGINLSEIIAPSAANGAIAEHVKGNADSKVILIEYGDFQCPACSSTASRIRVIVEEYKQDIAFVFRNFPLPQAHPNAKAAAAAAEAAGLQGKYWEMNEYIYKNQSAWSGLSLDSRTDWFKSAASALNLDADKLVTDMGSTAVSKKINFDSEVANNVDILGTPAFFLNGEELDIEIWSDDAKLKELLDEKIKEAKEKE